MECQYHIGTCLFCHSGNGTVRLKPFSAGERILAIDGGGTRGVIPLNILIIIERMMGGELQIQDLFDMAFGTSVARIKASGPVQDGGMSGHNNPIRIALSERQRNDPSLSAPDIVVSLGTGAQKTSASPRTTDFRHVILDGYVPRLWRSYMSSFNGQKIWDELMNSVDKRKREDYIRLNSVLPSDEPAIDNTERMVELQESVHVPEMYQMCKKTLYALLVSEFYFELANVERVREGQYHCRGTIRCRLPGIPFVKLLRLYNVSNLIFRTDVETVGYYGGESDLCPLCHRYQKKIVQEASLWAAD
ncbi:MAG: hypothetical protein Q9217_004009 [Psora testacea]